MRSLLVTMSLSLVVCALGGCNYDILKVNGRTLPKPTSFGEKPASELDFETIKAEILEPRCFDCHDSGSRKGDLADYANVMQKYVVPGNPQASKLFNMLQGYGGDMPRKSPPLPEAEAAAIRAWIEVGAPEKIAAKPGPVEPQPQPLPQPQPTPSPTPEATPTPAATPVEPTYAGVSSVMALKCVKCHSGVDAKADLDLSSFETMMKWVHDEDPTEKLVVPGDASKSMLYTIIRDEEMPRKKDIRSGKALPVTPEELEAIKIWIDSGATP